MGHHLGQTHERQFLHGIKAFEPLGGALRTANAGKPDAALRLLLQRAHQPAGEVVAGGFAGDDKDQRLLPAHANSFAARLARGSWGSLDDLLAILLDPGLRPSDAVCTRKSRP